MHFIKADDKSKFGVKDVPVNGKVMFAVSYEGLIITRLFKTEQEAVDAAAHMLSRLASEPIVGVLGFDMDKKVSVYDRIAFWQVVRVGHEFSLVVGTESGAFEEIFMADHRDIKIEDGDVFYGMRIYQVYARYARMIESAHRGGDAS